ncbi:potassium/proton antiporter [Hartmannibacter diazotrophicus]|uniref:potassium/proton antiporter n=1 Tax=Hartmannibacter diazotrophicus TaxID=1482074 RepID=UPI000C14F85F|nr:potassium/proton antiporter [Hartmannibacter diazotrophicus]
MDQIYMITLVGAGLIIVSAISSLLASRLGAPLLLLLLCIGLLAGEDGMGILFDNGGAAYFIGSLALAVILFDSGFGTSINSFKLAAMPALTLATLGVLLTTGLVALAAHWLFGLDAIESLLMGAIVSSTDAAAVFFLLRVGGVTMRDRVRSTLEVESGSNDPMAIFLTLTLTSLAAMPDMASGSMATALLIGFIRQMGLGLIGGFVGGMLILTIVNRLTLERGLYPIIVLACAIFLFSLVGAIGGSGFLAVYVAGLYAGNRHVRAKATLVRFQEGTTWLAQMIMFLVLGLLATPSQFPAIALPAIAIALFLIFVARPIAVWLCLLPQSFSGRETAFVAWVGLRGAVSILLAILPVIGGVHNGMLFFNTTFIVVLTSLLLQGWTVNPLARWLGLVLPPKIGPIEKVELELPGTANHELLAYRVVPDSPVTRGSRLPRWARPSLVIRDGKSMRYQYAGRLQPGDYVYLFISPRLPPLLDRLFASPAIVSQDDAEFFGEFSIEPDKTMGDLDAIYAVGIEEKTASLSIVDYMTDRLGGHAEAGDRMAVGPIELIVRDCDEAGRIAAVGLSCAPETPRVVKLKTDVMHRLFRQFARFSATRDGEKS